MKTNNYVIAFDLDGVLLDWEFDFCSKFGNKSRHLPNLFERYPEVDPGMI